MFECLHVCWLMWSIDCDKCAAIYLVRRLCAKRHWSFLSLKIESYQLEIHIETWLDSWNLSKFGAKVFFWRLFIHYSEWETRVYHKARWRMRLYDGAPYNNIQHGAAQGYTRANQFRLPAGMSDVTTSVEPTRLGPTHVHSLNSFSPPSSPLLSVVTGGGEGETNLTYILIFGIFITGKTP